MGRKNWAGLGLSEDYIPAKDPEWYLNCHVNKITLILTNRCNFNCEFCISKPRRGGKMDMETADAMNVINSLKNSMAHIRLTGGEPSLHKDFFKIFRAALKRNIVEVLSNGSFIPADPKEFSKKMEPILKERAGGLVFMLSMDPTHLKSDPKLKDRIFLLAHSIRKYVKPWYLDNHLQINVRGDFKRDVERMLSSLKGLSKETMKAIGGEHPFKYDEHRLIHPAESIVRVAGAEKYESAERGIRTRDFDRLREIKAGFREDEIVITPEMNAFVSVYSAYENMFQFGRGNRNWLTCLGNVKKIGMVGVAESLAWRQRKFSHFKEYVDNALFKKYGKKKPSLNGSFKGNKFWDLFRSKGGRENLKKIYKIYKAKLK